MRQHQGAFFQKRYKAVLRTVKFSTGLVNLLCFDLNFALRGFTNHVFVLLFELNSCFVRHNKASQKEYWL